MYKGEELILFDLNIGKSYLSDWNTAYAIREIIANALDEQHDGKPDVNITDDGTIIISDSGRGLKPEHLINQETEKHVRDDKIGKFGVGLKDAIGVLCARDIGVEIRSKGYEFNFAMKEKISGSGYETLHAVIKKIKNDAFKGTEFRICNCPSSSFEEAKLHFLNFQNPIFLATTIKGQVIDKRTEEQSSIYVNGMKISVDSNLRFSYNITSPSSLIKKGINRERQNVSRSVYQADIAKILENVEEQVVLDKLVEQLTRSYEGKNCSEVTWKNVIIRTCNYVIKKKETVFVSNDDIENNSDLINLISQNKEIKVIKISPQIKNKLKSNLIYIEKTKLFIEDYAQDLEETIPIEDLREDERNLLEEVVQLLKSIKSLRGERYLLDNICISKQSISYTDTEKSTVIIPRECLSSIENCSSHLINALASARHGSAQFKDKIIGNICLEFLQLKNKVRLN